MSYTYDYPRPALTVDAVVFRRSSEGMMVLLIKRKNDPFKGKWAFPGGFMDIDETVEKAVHRELKEETGLEGVNLKQFRVFSDPDRDPRGRIVSTVFYGFANDQQSKVQGADDADQAQWHYLSQLPPLAFDHQEIISSLKDELKL